MKRHGLFMKLWVFVSGIYLFFAVISSAHATYKTGWQSADYLQARIIGADTALGEDGAFTGAIEIRLSDGWHAYWRMPGAGGLPPRFNWDESSNLSSVDMKWPVPKRYQILDMHSFGYKNTVLLPFTAMATDKAADMMLRLKADIMVCNEICVPQHLEMALDVPVGA